MLNKRIDLGSIPFGLAVAGEDIVKGRAVVVKNVGGVSKAFYPTSQAEADAVKGFATLRIEDSFGGDKDHDVIKAGKQMVVYTLVKDNVWGTTEFDGTLAKDDALVVEHDDTDGKQGMLRKITGAEVTAERRVLATVFELGNMGSFPAIDFEVK